VDSETAGCLLFNSLSDLFVEASSFEADFDLCDNLTLSFDLHVCN